MASPGQKQDLCGHLMAAFDKHVCCAHCLYKGKGTDPCINNEDCQHCNILTEDQKSRLATPSYQKEKLEPKAISKESSSSLVDLP